MVVYNPTVSFTPGSSSTPYAGAMFVNGGNVVGTPPKGNWWKKNGLPFLGMRVIVLQVSVT